MIEIRDNEAHIEIEQYRHFKQLAWLDYGISDLTGHSFQGQVRSKDGQDTLLATFTIAATLVFKEEYNPTDNVIELSIELDEDTTEGLTVQTAAYDIEMIYPDTTSFTVFGGLANIVDSVTK